MRDDMRSLDVAAAARVITDFTLAVQPHETVLLVQDSGSVGVPDLAALADALVAGVRGRGAEPVVLSFPARSAAGMEPPRVAAHAMTGADVVILMTSLSILQTVATTEALAAGARVLMLPPARYLQNAPDLLDRLLPTDEQDEAVRVALAERLAAVFRAGRRVRVSSGRGTDLVAEIGRLAVLFNPARAHGPGQMTIVPGGQALAAVTEGAADGTVVIDGSASPMYRPLRSPIRLTIARGRVTEITGEEDAAEYRSLLERLDDPRVYGVAEIGVGFHPRAGLTGTPLEDERIYGAAWIALGTNVHLGGSVKAALHSDCVLLPPVTVQVDGRTILRDGQFDV